MKGSSVSILVVSILSAVFLSLTSPAQSGRPALSTGTPEAKPVNLKVLAGQDLTISQVRDIMQNWTDEIGADCSTCHVRNPKVLISGHGSRYNYADDSKQEKRTARVMYSMTEAINAQYIATVPNSGIPVTCGTCHRGHLSPEPFATPDAAPGSKAPATRGR